MKRIVSTVLFGAALVASAGVRRPLKDSTCPTALFPCNYDSPCTEGSYSHIFATCNIPPFPVGWESAVVLQNIANVTRAGAGVTVKAQTSDKAAASVSVIFKTWSDVYSGTVQPGQDLLANTVPLPVPGADNSVKVDAHNTWYTAAFYGEIGFHTRCKDGSRAGSDMCTGGTHFLYTWPDNGQAWWVTGGCSGSPGKCKSGGSPYCCPDGSAPTKTVSCGNNCVDCTGGCA